MGNLLNEPGLRARERYLERLVVGRLDPDLRLERLALRVDASRYAYQIRYPDRYFQPAIDSTQVLPTTRSKSKWLNNAAVTVGASYQFFR